MAAIFAWLMAAAAGPAAAQEAALTPDASRAEEVERLLRFFETVVFDLEFQDNDRRRAVSRWEGPIRVSLHGHGARRHRWTVKHHADLLSRATGLRIEVLGEAEGDGNIAVRFVAPSAMDAVQIDGIEPQLQRKLARSRGCFFVSYIDSRSRITRAEIIVNRERDDRGLRHCLLEEMTQSLGLPNDSDMIRPSLFSDGDKETTLQPHDEIVLRTLYHPDMRPGFHRVRALIVARRIIAGLLQEASESGRIVGTDDRLPRSFSLVPRKPAAPAPKPR